MKNPIHAALGLAPNRDGSSVVLLVNGSIRGLLTPARGPYSEGVYRYSASAGCYGPCYSAGPGPRTNAQIMDALRAKLGPGRITAAERR